MHVPGDFSKREDRASYLAAAFCRQHGQFDYYPSLFMDIEETLVRSSRIQIGDNSII